MENRSLISENRCENRSIHNAVQLTACSCLRLFNKGFELQLFLRCNSSVETKKKKRLFYNSKHQWYPQKMRLLIAGFQLTSLRLCLWTQTKAFHSAGSKTFCHENTTKKKYCFFHQHGRLFTLLKTSNRPFPSCPKALFKREVKFEASDIKK